ncbi:signal transduction histidine kinase [Mycena haematopus]|nr:signal transduction histidine kinase [Mycena haematopus]
MTSHWRVPSDIPIVDIPAFDQILELDDNAAHTYSKDMFNLYSSQVPTTFADMDAALVATDLHTLADRAHFLMGSSAALGMARVAAVCEEMERVGKASLVAADPESEPDESETSNDEGVKYSPEAALKLIAQLLEEGKREYADADRWLLSWYAENAQGPDEEEDSPDRYRPELQREAQ